MDKRDRLAPVSLTVERPVLHLILHAGLAAALCFEDSQHLCNGVFLVGNAVELAGIDHFSVTGIGFLFDIAALDDFDDINAEFLCEFVVTGIMRRNGHDRAGTVAHHNIVRDIDRDLLAGQRIDGSQAFDLDTGLILDELCTLKLGFLRAFRLIGIECVDIRDRIAVFLDHRMLRCHDHEGDAVEGIRARGIDAELFILLLDLEVYESAGRFADPVLLLELDIREIIDGFEAFEQLIRILGNAEIPDLFGLLNDITVADIALTALRILIGENDLAGGAVVDHGLIAEYESVLEHLEEDPLCPLVIAFLCGIDHARPVKGEADALELTGKLLDVFIGHLTRMYAGFDRGVFSRQTVSIEADREEDIIALQSALSADDLKAGISLDVTDVHTVAGGIREFNERIELFLIRAVHSAEGLVLIPVILPLFFDFGKTVFLHIKKASLSLNLTICNACGYRDEMRVQRQRAYPRCPLQGRSYSG